MSNKYHLSLWPTLGHENLVKRFWGSDPAARSRYLSRLADERHAALRREDHQTAEWLWRRRDVLSCVFSKIDRAKLKRTDYDGTTATYTYDEFILKASRAGRGRNRDWMVSVYKDGKHVTFAFVRAFESEAFAALRERAYSGRKFSLIELEEMLKEVKFQLRAKR